MRFYNIAEKDIVRSDAIEHAYLINTLFLKALKEFRI